MNVWTEIPPPGTAVHSVTADLAPPSSRLPATADTRVLTADMTGTITSSGTVWIKEAS